AGIHAVAITAQDRKNLVVAKSRFSNRFEDKVGHCIEGVSPLIVVQAAKIPAAAKGIVRESARRRLGRPWDNGTARERRRRILQRRTHPELIVEVPDDADAVLPS